MALDWEVGPKSDSRTQAVVAIITPLRNGVYVKDVLHKGLDCIGAFQSITLEDPTIRITWPSHELRMLTRRSLAYHWNQARQSKLS